MKSFKEQQIEELENLLALRYAEKSGDKVTVTISTPLAWLIRDLIGLQHIDTRVQTSFHADMLELNSKLGYRSDSASLSRWSDAAAQRLVEKETT